MYPFLRSKKSATLRPALAVQYVVNVEINKIINK